MKYLQKIIITKLLIVTGIPILSFSSPSFRVSSYAFSEADQLKQQQYIEQVIDQAEYGSVSMNFLTDDLRDVFIDDFIRTLYSHSKKGNVKIGPNNCVITWKPSDAPALNNQKNAPPVFADWENGNAIGYSFSGGRLGDNLVAYFHAKWLAYKYNLPLRYVPFPYADQFCLSNEDQVGSSVKFRNIVHTANETVITSISNSTLYVIPYFCENTDHLYDLRRNYRVEIPSFYVDWENPEFHAEVVRCLTPKNSIVTAKLPTDKITVGVHVRRGCGGDDLSIRVKEPLKFPHDSYYIEQIKRVARIFKDRSLYVYILTDDRDPSSIVETYQKAINNPNLYFDCRKEKHDPDVSFLEDFFLIPQFDCLIICQSNFSLMASKIADHILVITPVHPTFVDGYFMMDEVDVTFNSKKQGKL